MEGGRGFNQDYRGSEKVEGGVIKITGAVRRGKGV